MNRTKIFVIAAVAAVFAVVLSSDNFRTREHPVLLVYNPSELKDYGHILKAYEHVLQEMGVPFAKVKPSFLLSHDPNKFGAHGLTLIFPDGCAQSLPDGLSRWMEFFLAEGGSAAVIYDAGVKDPREKFRKEGIFTGITGINNITYEAHKEDSFTHGNLRLKSEAVLDTLAFPRGKLDKQLFLTGYAYGRLSYPLSRVEARPLPGSETLAEMIAEDGKVYPGAVIRRTGKGAVMFADIPLGRLKSFSDDLPIKAFLRGFLYKTVKVPHLEASPGAVGGIVFNWHIDSAVEWKSIPLAIKRKFLRPGIRYSIHITAGDFRDAPGDGLGFDACGRGRELTTELMKYGVIGSHGGWAHNWFPENLAEGVFSKDEIKEYIKKNNDCLSSITGYPITEYSAPNGVHPQPEVTRALEELGMRSYYYTGDTGSGPNHTFISGTLVSDNVYAFPVMPYGKSASFYEIHLEGKTEAQVYAWLKGIVSFSEKHRTIRLIYSHLYDTERYPSAVSRFTDLLEKEQAAGRLKVEPMSYFTSFLERFEKTQYKFDFGNDELTVKLGNPEGLNDIYMAIPANRYNIPEGREGFDGGDGFFYVKLKDDNKDVITAPSR